MSSGRWGLPLAARRKEPESEAQDEIDTILLGLRKAWPVPIIAASFLALRAAEAAGLISSKWRAQLDCPTLDAMMARDPHALSEYWEEKFNYFRRLITDPDGLNDDEMLIVLGQRSTLELVGAFLGGTYLDRAAALDEAFTESLRYNAVVVGPNRARTTLGLEARLPTHWWWRQDTPG